eukprot:6176611-Pleurochrysis_carterae.AAC.1
MRERADSEEEWKLLRKRARQGLKVTRLEKRTADGLAQQKTGKASKLAAKRAKRAAKAIERARIDALPLAEHYFDLKLMGVEDLQDQLKKQKLLGKRCFSRPTRTPKTSRTATPASRAAAFGAARLSEDGSAGVGCAPTWAT